MKRFRLRLPGAACALLLLALPLAACDTTPDEQCQGFGYSRPSTAWIECVHQLEQAGRH
ncbi:hypothetical protein [Zavarzinia sp. CC-PAN008]|uniref:hypothetical protein n=1 Tax=Zavarzinia sp. CC-PAN008 TaxID=3243332 RepID=UPI003F742A26